MKDIDRAVTEMLAKVSLAADFAARKHAQQKRKGELAEPYINHLADVANLIASSIDEPDWVLICAAWLHDTVEDTATTKEEILEIFGEHVTSIVMEVTDDKSLPKPSRKELQVIKTPSKSNEAKLIKLADKTSNLRSLGTSPPTFWDAARTLAYVDWAEQVVSSCLPLNEKLAQSFKSAAQIVRTKAAMT
jgi:(p)ppGpp synthase/HD superfamily hydrolase